MLFVLTPPALAVAMRLDLPIFTVDGDCKSYQAQVPILLHEARRPTT